MSSAKESIGQRFGRLTVVELKHVDKHRRRHVLCECDCGSMKVIPFALLSSGSSRSCGCLHKETAAANGRASSTTHGMAGSPTYKSWCAMLARCGNPNGNRAHIYASVQIDPRWLVFENFLSDMGVRPEGGSLDRYPKGEGNYEPGNCRWATAREQALNRSTTRNFEIDGVTYSMKDLAEKYGIKRLTLLMRLKRGWSIERALSEPVRK